MAKVIAVCISETRGEQKKEVPYIDIKENHGIIGDAHAGNWHRQISLLSSESIDSMRHLVPDLPPGTFAENIVTTGITLYTLPIGTLLQVGNTIIEVTQIGKKCHQGCAIMKATGQCVMPKQGIFAIVKKGGRINPEDEILILEQKNETN